MITKDFTDSSGTLIANAIWKCSEVQGTEDEVLAKCVIHSPLNDLPIGIYNFSFKPDKGSDYHTQAEDRLKELI